MLVAGNLKVEAGSVLGSGVAPPETQIVILALGKSVSFAKNVLVTATVVAPNATCTTGTTSVVVGALLCGKNVTIGTGGKISIDPSIVTLP